MRPDPGSPPQLAEALAKELAEADKRLPAGMVRQVRRYELITPLFGGGVVPQQADPITVVRGSEVRGQLRFWWRATRGGRFGGDLRRMQEAEDQLWGAAGGEAGPSPSKVTVAVTGILAGEVVYPYKIVEKDGTRKLRENQSAGVPGYAAFPLQPDEHERLSPQTKLAGVRRGVAFNLTIEFPDDEQSAAAVEAALWAWETFGGLGGRTRRGFGALRRSSGPGEPLPAAGDARTLLTSLIQKHCPEGRWPPAVPHLGPDLNMRFVTATDAADAWDYLIYKLRKFRQARGEDGYGPSQWPEPDSIRRRTSSRRGYTPSHPVNDKYPRAAFGLPIVFKFRQKDEDRRDPKRTILQGEWPHARMASPLILKPLACAGGEALGLAAILQGTTLPPGGVKLKYAPQEPTVTTELDPQATPPDAAAIPVLNGESDVLRAFLKSLPLGAATP